MNRHCLPALLLAGLLSCGGAQPGPAVDLTPALIGDGWERQTPASAGFDAPRLQAVLEQAAGEPIDLHSLVVERHGRLVAELYQAGKDRGVYSLSPGPSPSAPPSSTTPARWGRAS